MKLFEDLPSTNTPITAENLNQIQDNLVVVSSTEPTGDNREKVWMQNTETEQKIYVKNDNDVYEEFYRKEDINDLITTQNFTSSEITVATNSFKTSSILVKKAGYTPKGIVMADMSNNNVILSKFSLFGTTVYINLLNYSGSDQTTTVTIKVLYTKTTD